MTVRVLIADDEALVRRGFSLILAPEDDIEIAGEAPDGNEAVSEALRLRPDVVLMDIRMPHLDGIEATRRIVDGQAGRVLIVTTFGDDEYVYDALRAGAAGFLLKNTPAEQLIDAIRVVAQGDALLSPSITRRLIEDVARRKPSPAPRVDEIEDILTARELDVLRLVARGLSNAEIAQELVLSEATIKTHIGHVLMKLELRDRTQAAVLAYESGLVVPEDRA
ncbi:MAG: response regulator [Actinobacteria bacterium]|nr:response regulator [Actinomycetota bacterium]